MWAIAVMLLMVAVTVSSALAVDYADVDTEITPEEQEQFDEILEPVVKIYNFVKYVATVVAVIILAIAGISFMTSGTDPKKRDTAKGMATYVVLGLLVIWAAPMIVGFLI
ncbi:MAG TPA: pilin [Candidatus Nanoarchaeia archaeon]|nr:pilin [Candidatus Nanoarchaeia archaeon]